MRSRSPAALGVLGSVDANRNDYQSGWDTDQFPNNAPELSLALHAILKAGGLGAGGFNFDARARRQSFEPIDLIYAHIGGIDTLARALVAAAAMIEDGALDRFLAERYAGWIVARARKYWPVGAAWPKWPRGSSATISIRSRAPVARSISRIWSTDICDRAKRSHKKTTV